MPFTLFGRLRRHGDILQAIDLCALSYPLTLPPCRLSEATAQKRVVAVIVLYRTTAEASESYRSLLKARERLDDERLDLKILLHDNSPEPASPGVLPPFVLYAAPGENKGLAGAYNRALSFALEEGYDWLLTLDQDLRFASV